MANLLPEIPSIQSAVRRQFRTVVRWLRLLLPILGALLGLYAVFFMLQFISLVPELKGFRDQALGPMQLSLSAADIFSDDTHVLKGNTHSPNAAVEIGVNEHLLDTTRADANGIFNISIKIPAQANYIWVRARDPRSGRILATDQMAFSWGPANVEPSLQLAYAVPKSNLVWVAGSAAPNSWIQLYDEKDNLVGEVRGNDSGGFDAMLSMDDTVPAAITARANSADGPRSEPLPVSPLEELPLSRQAAFDLNASQPVLRVLIRLPVAHPNLQSLIQGYMTPVQFLQSTFPLGEAWVASDVSHTISFGPKTDEPPMAAVDITVKWRYALPLITIYRGPLYPLLTDKDLIVLNFKGVKPAWFNQPYPTNLEADQAIWRGKLTDRGSSYEAIKVSLTVPPGTPTINAPEPEVTAQDKQSDQKKIAEQEKKMLDFIRSFETSGGRNLGASSLRTLILLIPYAAMLWLWRRRRFGRPEAWLPLATMVIVLAVWRIWNYLFNLMEIGPGLWLQKAIIPMRIWLDLSGTKEQNILISDASGNAYCILLLGLLALTPLYLPVLEQVLVNLSEPVLPASHTRFLWARRTLLGIRILLGTLVLLLILAFFQMQDVLASHRDGYPFASSFIRRLVDALASRYYPDLFNYLTNSLWLAVATAALITLFLWIWSWRAGLFGIGFLIIAARTALVLAWNDPRFRNDPAFSLVQNIVGIPWWVFLGIAAALTYPLVHRMLRILAPSALTIEKRKRLFRWLRSLITIGLIGLALWLPHTSSIFVLGTAGVLILSSLVYLVYYGFKNLQTTRKFIETVRTQLWIAALFIVLILALALPIAGTRIGELRLQTMFSLVAYADQMFAFILALGLVLLLREDDCADSTNPIFGPPLMEAGIVLFAVFMINSSTSWLFIPIPFLAGLIVARTWLFQPESEAMKIQAAIAQSGRERERMIRDILDESQARYSYKKIESSLNKKMEAAEITGKQYEKRIAAYRQHFGDRLNLEEYPYGLTSKKIAFAVGENTPWSNTRQMLGLGALLALLPLLVALYEYLPSNSVAYPYPLADLLVFLLSASASWMLYAFFFGYFYIHLRGNNGLTKGLVLFVGLVIPFATYRLLSAQTLQEMRPFLLWAAQIFLFCSMLGLLGVEYRLIRQHGYRMRDLLAAHNLPALSVYVSTVIAALAPTIIAALTGRLGDVVEFFLNTVLPRVPGGAP